MDEKKKVDFIVKHKLFWLGVAVIVILPLIGFMVLELSPSPAAGKAIQTVSYKKAGSQLHFEIKDITGLKETVIKFSQDFKNQRIIFEENKNIPFDEKFYNKFTVSSEAASKISEIKFTLKLKEAELTLLGINPVDVRLYVNGQALETKQTKAEGNYIFYEAASSRLGDFVIGRAKPKPKEKKEIIEEPTVEEGIPEEEIIPPEVEEETPPAIEKPAPVKKGFFSRIFSFFKKVFSIK